MKIGFDLLLEGTDIGTIDRKGSGYAWFLDAVDSFDNDLIEESGEASSIEQALLDISAAISAQYDAVEDNESDLFIFDQFFDCLEGDGTYRHEFLFGKLVLATRVDS
jgi:hypothetical protein